MIWNCLYRHFEEFLMKIQVFGSLFKTSKLVVEMNFYHVCHKCMESCFLKEWILINQVKFSVWIFKASCWNEFHYDMVSLFLISERNYDENSSLFSSLIHHLSFKSQIFSAEMNNWTSYHTFHNDMEYCFLEEVQ